MTPSNPDFDYDACDCHLCDLDRRHPDPIREEVRMTAPGCTCSKRFSYTDEHDSDCDLWYVDEFWAGFVAWSPDEECLVRTATYPADHDDPWSSAYAADIHADEEYEWVDDQLSKYDTDAATISGMFLDKVLGKDVGHNTPPSGNGAWEKREDGLWYPLDDDATYASTLSKMSGRVPGGSGTATGGYSSGWDDDWYWKNCHAHYETEVTFPDGTKVQASSIGQNGKLRTNGEPDFGLYMADSWRNEGIGMMLPWQDWGLPSVRYELAAEAIRQAFNWAKAGMLVEAGCIGAHGRTGTVLSCMAILAGVDRASAVSWVRSNYCHDAVEGISQEWFVKWFAAYINGEDPPAPLPKPKPVASTPKAQGSSNKTSGQTSYRGAGASTNGSTSIADTPDPNKPGRKKRNRRGKRGGKRVQRSRQLQSVGGSR